MHYKNYFSSKITAKAVIILLLASCFYFYEFTMQVAPGVIARDLMRDFAIDATKLGALSGCFYYSYTALQLPLGLLLDRYSTRIILTFVCTICAAGVLLFAHAPNMLIASFARFIMGGASACAFISVLHLIIRWVPPTYFALFTGIVEMMGSIGALAGTAPLAHMLKHFTWRETMTWFSYIGFLLALLIMLVIRDKPKKLKNMPETQQKYSIFESLKVVLHNRQTWFIGAYSFFIWAPILGFSALWGITFLRISCNFSNIIAAQAIAFVWIGIGISGPIIGSVSDFYKKRRGLMTICAIFGAIAMTVLIFERNIPILFLDFLMFILGVASAGQTLSFALIKDNNAVHTNSAANGFNNMVIVAGGMLFQPLIGKFLDLNWNGVLQDGIRIYDLHSYQIAFLILPICFLSAAFFSAFFIKEP